MRCPFFFFKVTFQGLKRTPYFFDEFSLELTCLAFNFTRSVVTCQDPGFTLTYRLSVQITEKMPCGLQNGRRQPENVFFLCFIHLQWINLFFAVSPLHLLSFLQHTTPQKEQKQTNKKPRNPTKKEHQPQLPKSKETKQIAHPKRGKMQRIGFRHIFVLLFCLFFWFLVFLVPCFF